MEFFNAEFFSIVLFFISFYALITGRNILKSVISILLMETSVIMFIVSIGFSDGMSAPIGKNPVNTSDPLPQALVLTAIIIGIAVAAVNLTMLISMYRQYKTTDWDTVKKMTGSPAEDSDSTPAGTPTGTPDNNPRAPV